MTTKRQKPLHLSLHSLITQLSYWGTTTRILLISFLAIAVIFIRILEAQASSDVSLFELFLSEGQLFIYTVGSFFILDLGYVLIARAYSFAKVTDVAMLLLTEVLMATLYFLPYLAIVPERFASITRWVFVGSLLVVSVRLVLGMLYGKSAKK